VRVRQSETALAVRLMGLGLTIAGCCSADAQPARGDFGARSEATIRISVSVAPRFQSRRSASADENGASADALTRFASNAPNLRYSVRALPALPAEGGLAKSDPLARRSDANGGHANLAESGPQQAERAGVLYLIIPD
jgi:hypothetical protein